MLVIRNENPVPCDIDNTLVLHNPKNPASCTYVDIDDPVQKGKKITLAIHKPNVRLLLEELARGSFIIVWSKGGFQWAENVLKALGIDHKNIIILTKPKVYIDDKPVSSWMKDRVCLNPNEFYKGVK